MKKYLTAAISLIVLMVGTSCVHHSPYKTEYWFQALGSEGEYVVTADVERFREGEGEGLISPEILESPVAKKAERVSLSLLPSEEDGEYLAPLSSFVMSGALEGDYSSFAVNTSLGLSKFEKEKEEGVVWHERGELKAHSPSSGIVLFTDGDYKELYSRTIENREKLIDDESAEAMASSLFSLYVFEPQALVDIGFEIPETVLAQITRTCLLFDEKDGGLVISGIIETEEEGNARALTTLLKNQVIQEKRRKGEKLDTKSLAGSFVTENNSVFLISLPLSGDMKEKAEKLMREGIGGML